MKRLLYGMRKASSGWEEDYAGMLVQDWFMRGKLSTNSFLEQNYGIKGSGAWI